MYHSLAGKVVMITGAANGIGRAAAQYLASNGARLMLSDINEPAGRTVLRNFRELGLDARFTVCDVTDGLLSLCHCQRRTQSVGPKSDGEKTRLPPLTPSLSRKGSGRKET